tara:strand:- start:202 stop:846 length:645 start_codon:yes stop_codon:yes gene_type:complete
MKAKAKIKGKGKIQPPPVVDPPQRVNYDSGDDSEKTINTEYPNINKVEDIVCNMNFEEKATLIEKMIETFDTTEITKLQKRIHPKENTSTLFEKQFLASFGFSVGKGGLNKKDILEALSVEYRKRIDDKKHDKGKTIQNNQYMRELLQKQLKIQNPQLFQELKTKHESQIEKQKKLLSKEKSKSTSRSNTNQSKNNLDEIKALMQNTDSDSDSN